MKTERKENKMGEVFGWKMVKGKERKKKCKFLLFGLSENGQERNKMGDVFTHLFLPNWRGKKNGIEKENTKFPQLFHFFTFNNKEIKVFHFLFFIFSLFYHFYVTHGRKNKCF